MNTKVYILRCLSNLHAGSGDSQMGVIDKQVQRDPSDRLPTIHSSSLKGALREYFEKNKAVDQNLIQTLFGGKPGDDASKASGNLYFGRAMLLSLPVRSDKLPYFCVTSPDILAGFSEQLRLNRHAEAEKVTEALKPLVDLSWKESGQPRVFRTNYNEAILEEESLMAQFENFEPLVGDQKAWREKAEEIIGHPFALMKYRDFQEIAHNLPVIARNQLNNGVSENLWYEEVVPREARFALLIQGDEGNLDKFSQYVDNQVIQLGGNATVGYGQTLFQPLTV